MASSSGTPSVGPASNNSATTPAQTGPNWVKLEGPEYPFSALFPTAAPEKKDPFAAVSDPQMRKLAEAMGKTDMWARLDGGRGFSLTVRELPAAPPAAQVKQALNTIGTAASMSAPGGKMEEVDSTSGDWKGYPYRQFTFKKPTGDIMIIRAMIAKATLYVLSVEGDSGLSASDKMVEEFFSGFEPKPKDAPAGPGAGTKAKGTTTPPKSGGKSKKP